MSVVQNINYADNVVKCVQDRGSITVKEMGVTRSAKTNSRVTESVFFGAQPSFSGDASLTKPIENEKLSYIDDAAKPASRYITWLCLIFVLVWKMGGYHRSIIKHTQPEF